MRQPVQQLIELYQTHLYAAAFNICQNQMDAEDVVQETFVQYYTSKKEFESEQHIRAWLLRVVINKAKNISRTFWRKNKCSLDDYMETLSFPNSQSRDYILPVDFPVENRQSIWQKAWGRALLPMPGKGCRVIHCESPLFPR